MALIRQTSFAGGVIDKALHSRTDHPMYGVCLADAKNFIITSHGAAANRSGLKFVAHAKSSVAANKVRLIPFVYSESVSFVLELGNLYMRFYVNGARVPDGVGVYEKATAWTTARLPYLKWAQLGRVMTIVDGGTANDPYEVTWDGNADTGTWTAATWTVTAIDFDLPPAYFNDAKPYLFDAPLPTEDVANGMPAENWVWSVTAIGTDPVTGATFETEQYTVEKKHNFAGGAFTDLGTTKFPVYPKKPITVRWSIDENYMPSGYDSYGLVGWRVYRGRTTTNVLGLIGETKAVLSAALGSTQNEFIDVGNEPDYSARPPYNLNPFIFLSEKPNSVGYFQQRMVFGGSTQRPGYLWLSRVNDFLNFEVAPNGFPVAADTAVAYDLASMRREQIRSIHGLDRLYILTSGGMWTFELVDATQPPLLMKHSDEGASWMPPLVVSDSLLYTKMNGTGVLEAAFNNERGKMLVRDLGFLAPRWWFLTNSFTTNGISDWAKTDTPHRLVWMVSDLGILLALTYDRANEVIAWTRSDSYLGVFEAICSVPENGKDVVYVSVRRGLTRNIERMLPRDVSGTNPVSNESNVFLDSYLSYSGVPATVFTGLDHLDGYSNVYAVADGVVVGPLTVTAGQVSIAAQMPEGASDVHVGLRYDADLESLDLAAAKTELRGKQKNVTAAGFDVVATRGFWVGEPAVTTLEGEASAGTLTEWRQRQVAHSNDATTAYTGFVKVPILSSWNTRGRIRLRQVDPLPITVHGLAREVQLGGD